MMSKQVKTQSEDKQKATWLIPRELMKRIKQDALNEGITATAWIIKVATKHLDKKDKKDYK
jgi:hypothetical protein